MAQQQQSFQQSDMAHFQALSAYAETQGWNVIQDATMRMLDGSCLYDLAWRERQYRNYILTDDWEYAEISFKAYGRFGLKTHWVDYSIMRMPLPRKLPNVVFDSKEHQRKQFRVTFDPSQSIQLEGKFNEYFSVYFGKDYTIDDLSFITPEVMEALIAAQKYDIEIVHDSLLIFGQIESDPKQQLEEMTKAVTLIRKKLLHNILTYRDERLPYDEGRKVVARAGMFLRRQYHIGWVVFLTILLLLIGGVIILNFIVVVISYLGGIF